MVTTVLDFLTGLDGLFLLLPVQKSCQIIHKFIYFLIEILYKMPPKAKANAPSKKTEEKKKTKIVEVRLLLLKIE